MSKVNEIKEYYTEIYVDDYGDYETITIDKKDYDTLIDNAEKFQRISDAWLENINNMDYETVQFLRVCKEVIEDIEIPKRNKRT